MTTSELTDEYWYQAERSALGLSPDADQATILNSLLSPPKAPRVSAAEQRVVNEVREEWERQQEFERLAILQAKCNKLQHFLW